METDESIRQAKEVLQLEAESILQLIDRVGEDFSRAVELIYHCTGRVIVAGIGKSSFRRKPESSYFKMFWTPAFAGVTTKVSFQRSPIDYRQWAKVCQYRLLTDRSRQNPPCQDQRFLIASFLGKS